MKKPNILIACEESQTICNEFRNLGFNAYSCDIQECSGGHPEWHFNRDCFDVIENGGGELQTGGYQFIVGDWDLVIAHPPCTYLARCGERLMNVNKYGEYAKERLTNRVEAANFFMRFTNIRCKHIAIENPVGYMTGYYRKPDQIIHPWMFGDNVSKATCLWLKGLPELNIDISKRPENMNREFFTSTRFLKPEDRRRARSKTFPGIAHAIATQWGQFIQTINN